MPSDLCLRGDRKSDKTQARRPRRGYSVVLRLKGWVGRRGGGFLVT
jgi:hypothetical protein